MQCYMYVQQHAVSWYFCIFLTQLMIIYTIFTRTYDPAILKITTPFPTRVRTLFCSCWSGLHSFQPLHVLYTTKRLLPFLTLNLYFLCVTDSGFAYISRHGGCLEGAIQTTSSTWSFILMSSYCSMGKYEEHFYKKISSI